MPSANPSEFLARLQRHPELQAKFDALLDVVENAAGDATKADEVEQRVFEELRLLGQQAIQTWAERKQRRIETDCDARSDLARKQTQQHAAQMKEGEPATTSLPKGGVAQVIAETDGCMIPIVKIATKGPKDRRKRRLVDWQEARLSLAYRAGSLSKYYQATLQAVEVAGGQLLECARQAGAGQKSRIHCVGDGASWIVRQVAERFGGRANYLIDFYHVSQYLAQAGEAISSAPQAWRKRQQERLKGNRVGQVLDELKAHLEEEGDNDQPAPVRACWRYLSNRLENLDYKGAIAAGLPIGSGEIESGNRSVIQARLKRSGAWWKEENAEAMLALRTLRASGQWESYWQDLRQAAA